MPRWKDQSGGRLIGRDQSRSGFGRRIFAHRLIGGENRMSAPFIWIFIPVIVGGLSLFVTRERVAMMVGGVTAIILTVAALIVPIDEALGFGSFSLKVASSFQILGRNLTLDSSEAPLLAILFGVAALWFFGAESAGVAKRLTPFGLIIISLLVASIAVQPFLYAALLIELSVLVAVPLFSPADQTPSRGVIRFLTYQTLGMPFILVAGWLSAGVEASPGDLALTIQSTMMLGLGFAFLFAVFPLYNWMPLLMEESSPYVIGFLLWLLPTITSILGMNFLDRYAWLRTSAQVMSALRVAGLLMVVSGGIWTAFQRHHRPDDGIRGGCRNRLYSIGAQPRPDHRIAHRFPFAHPTRTRPGGMGIVSIRFGFKYRVAPFLCCSRNGTYLSVGSDRLDLIRVIDGRLSASRRISAAPRIVEWLGTTIAERWFLVLDRHPWTGSGCDPHVGNHGHG